MQQISPFIRLAIVLGVLALLLGGAAQSKVAAHNTSPVAATNADQIVLNVCSAPELFARGATNLMHVFTIQHDVAPFQPLFHILPQRAIPPALNVLFDARMQLWAAVRNFAGTVLNCMFTKTG